MSAKYKVMITRVAQKQIKKMSALVLPRVIACLEELEKDSHPTGVEKLNQNPNFWRLKAGSQRIVYTIIEESRTIVVALIGPRREIYRDVANLDERHIMQMAVNDVAPPASSGTRH